MSYANGPRIVTDGLVLCLDAGNRKSYPGSGNTWYDLSGGDNHVQKQGAPTFVDTNRGVFSFDGSDDRFEAGNIVFANMHGSAGCTLESWTKLTGAVAPTWVVLNPHLLHDGKNYSTGLLWNSSTLTFRVHQRTSITRYYGDTTTTFSLSEIQKWHYYAQVYDPPYIKVYVDGSLFQTVVSNASGTVSASYLNFLIGGWKDPTLRLLSQQYIAVSTGYNRALNASEIYQNYNALKGRYGL